MRGLGMRLLSELLCHMLLYLAADLIWATKIKASAEALGLPCRPVRTMDMLEARLAEWSDADPIAALLLDLEKPEEALAFIARMRGSAAGPREKSVRLLAFGPHVARELFQKAREAGADEVMARGALDHNMGDVLLALAARRNGSMVNGPVWDRQKPSAG